MRIAIWRKLSVGLGVIIISDSEPETERIEDVGDRRDRKRDRNVWAGRMLGGVWARNLVFSLLYLVKCPGMVDIRENTFCGIWSWILCSLSTPSISISPMSIQRTHQSNIISASIFAASLFPLANKCCSARTYE